MYIVVIGGGKVGYYLAKALLQDGHELLVVEKDQRKCEAIAEELGQVVLQGDGCEVATLEQAGVGRAGVLIAVTGDDEDNLVACQVAKRRFQVPRTIARINNPKNEAIFKKLGIDVTVSSTDLILAQIEQEIPTHSLVHLLTLKGVGVGIVEMRLPPDSPALGRPLKDLGIPDESILSLVIRQGKAIIPYGNTVLEAEDEVLAVTTPQDEPALRRILLGQAPSQ
ncbi:MAG: TrkA family potassium uptake protein [Chloroflexi bacterium]|nr:TrkA family potassium uptake protein [Chloroflexota bacterium]